MHRLKNASEFAVASLVSLLFMSYGWISIVNDGVHIASGVRGKVSTAHLSGLDANLYISAVFALAAVFSFYACRMVNASRLTSLFVGLITLAHPVAILYLAQ